MAEWEDVPTDSELALTPEDDREEWLADVFSELALSAAEAKTHDRDGFYAYEPGSKGCIAAGHHQETDGWGAWMPEDEHVDGWNDPLCLATRYGTACCACEGECDARRLDVHLWLMPGVRGTDA